MASKITLKAEKRKITGRKVKQLRAKGVLPANLYGKGIKSQSLQFKLTEFNSVYEKVGETNLLYLTVAKQKEVPVLVSNIQIHPVTSALLHADLYQVDLKKKVTVNIPVVLTGESSAVAEGGVLVQTLKELEVEALPGNIPESVNFDISGLQKIGDSLKISAAKSLKDATITQDKDTVIVMIQAQQEEEVEQAPQEEDQVEGEEGETQSEESVEAKKGKPAEDEAKKEDPKAKGSSEPVEEKKN